MRRIRLLPISILFLTAGTFAWSSIAQQRSAVVVSGTEIAEPTGVQQEAEAIPGPEEDSLEQSIKSSSPEPVTGYANAKSIVLRESPEAGAPILAKLKMGEYDAALILDSTRDFLKVKFAASDGSNGTAMRAHDFVGWTEWGAVTPYMSALVLDTETGAVVSRVPLGEMLGAIAYSPDGARAIFNSGQGNMSTACEMKTSDYKVLRCLTSEAQDSSINFFYGPADGALYAAIIRRAGEEPAQLKVVRIGEEGALNIPTGISGEAEDFVISPDGLTGFVLHSHDSVKQELKVDVIDLMTFTTRNSFTLKGDGLPLNSGTFVVNRDGTKLFARLYQDVNAVYVIDTRTGLPLQLMNLTVASSDVWYFGNGDLVGDSLLLKIWNQDQEGVPGPPNSIWLGSDGRRNADQGIAFAVQAGEARYAINDTGTTMFKLDSDNRIRNRLSIERPELLRKPAEEQGLGILGLRASPDGKRLVVFIGVEDGC